MFNEMDFNFAEVHGIIYIDINSKRMWHFSNREVYRLFREFKEEADPGHGHFIYDSQKLVINDLVEHRDMLKEVMEEATNDNNE